MLFIMSRVLLLVYNKSPSWSVSIILTQKYDVFYRFWTAALIESYQHSERTDIKESK